MRPDTTCKSICMYVVCMLRMEISDEELVGSVRGKTLKSIFRIQFSCNKPDEAFDKPSYV